MNRFLVVAAFSTLCVSIVTQVHATTDEQPISLEVGDVFEMTVDTESPDTNFSWILTKDRAFQSAGRERFFQMRPTEPGEYTLDVTVQDPINETYLYRAFRIQVVEQGSPSSSTESDSTPLQAVLISDHGTSTLFLPESGARIKLDPSQSTGRIGSYSLDLDTSVDSNGDGIPDNDNDTEGTSFERIGTPLFVYMFPRDQRAVTLRVQSAEDENISSITLPVTVGTPSDMTSDERVQHAGEIGVKHDNGIFRFFVELPDYQGDTGHLLYEWDFGDRSRSLLTRPTHKYAAIGTFPVSVRIRDIRTGEVLFTSTANIVVEEESVSSQSSSEASSGGDNEENSSFSVGGIVKVLSILLVLLAIAIGLYLLFIWIKKKSARGLQKTLEKMEGTIVETQEQRNGKEKAAPIKIKKESSTPKANILSMEEVREKETGHTDFDSTMTKAPMTTPGPVPGWLKNNEQNTKPPTQAEEKKTPKRSTAAPSSAMRVTPPATRNTQNQKPESTSVQPPAPTAQTQSPQTTLSTNGPVPAWLKSPANDESKPQRQTPPTPEKPATSESKPRESESKKPSSPSQNPTPPATGSTPQMPEPKKPSQEREKKQNANDDEDPPIAFIQADSLQE